MAKVRLDKYLAEMGKGTRTQVKQLIRKGRVSINEEIVKTPEYKVNSEVDVVKVDNQSIAYCEYVYYMLNKPQGVISATEDRSQSTVIDLITDKKRKDLFPVGRLDKDTEGLLLITNDGELAHELLAPKKHVEKTYYARIKGIVTSKDVETFQHGVKINKEFTAMPAKLKILKSGEESEIEVTIVEGKFHQVKRMFIAVGKEVVYLKRISMAGLVLDEKIGIGNYRELTNKEVESLRKNH